MSAVGWQDVASYVCGNPPNLTFLESSKPRMAPPWVHDLSRPLGGAVPLGWATESIYLAVKKPCLLRKTVVPDSCGELLRRGLNYNAKLVRKMMFTVGGT